MQIIKYPERKDWTELLRRPVSDVTRLEKKVEKILKAVQKKGDKSVRKYTRKFDGVTVNELQVGEDEILQATDLLSPELKGAIQLAAANIETFHKSQVEPPEWIVTMPGIMCSRKSLPIDKVGLYIPGGTAPLFSTVLMLGIPANLAGCREIVLCTPPASDAKIHK